ncbi:MAG: hypothetical protein NC086_10830 [Alistipes sp.]|nr:hypothetical protein [Alistipes sp.]
MIRLQQLPPLSLPHPHPLPPNRLVPLPPQNTRSKMIQMQLLFPPKFKRLEPQPLLQPLSHPHPQDVADKSLIE